MTAPEQADLVFFDGFCPACRVGKAQICRTDRPIQKARCPRCGIRWSILSVNLYLEDALELAALMDKQARDAKKKTPFLLNSR